MSYHLPRVRDISRRPSPPPTGSCLHRHDVSSSNSIVISPLSPLTSTTDPRFLLFHPKHTLRDARSSLTFPLHCSAAPSGKSAIISSSINQNPPRSLFSGGSRRPEIRVPNLVLRLTVEDVLRDEKTVLDIIDGVVNGGVGIVVLTGSEGSDKKLYEAACLLKSVIRDRAYMLIDERVDIATAVNANGVLLSDQGLPTIVARNTMMDAKTDSVIIPLVGRNVDTHEAALDASNSEGADFLIYRIKEDNHLKELVRSVFVCVNIPIFIFADSPKVPLGSLISEVSGVVVSMDELNSSRENELIKSSYSKYSPDKYLEDDKTLVAGNGFYAKQMVGGFTGLKDREKQFIEEERLILLEAIRVIEKATPQMGDLSILKDAVSQLGEPFSLVIVGEFNSGKSSVINALLGKRYLKDGVVPTTNEITFLRYCDSECSEQQFERHLDGRYMCFIPAPILKEMAIVDTPGTNVILQRQQRMTEEFVPRADLILFVLSADRPLTESEVTFLRYIQQWKKKILFVLNKSDLYRGAEELDEAITYIKENIQKMLNADQVNLYPVSARSTLEAKLSAFPRVEKQEEYSKNSYPGANKFTDLEEYLYSFLDVSTNNGMERIRLKLQTPVTIADQLLSSCRELVTIECQQAKQDFMMVNNIVVWVREYGLKMEDESVSWKRQILSLVSDAQTRAIKLADSTLQLSNLDIVTSYLLKRDKSAQMPVTSILQNEIFDPAASQAEKLLGEYSAWLHSNKAREGNKYKELFEKRWPLVAPSVYSQLEANELLRAKFGLGVAVFQDFSAAAASKLFEQEIREVLLGTFGGLGVAGLSASLLTSVLPTTLEDLLALSLCSAGGLLAISNLATQRQKLIDKVKRTANSLARQLEEAMQKDLLETIKALNNFVTLIGKPYQESAQARVNKLSGTLDELKTIEGRLEELQIEIRNIGVLR